MTTGDAERGVFGTIVLSIGGGCLLVALVSVFNVALDLELALEVSGTSTALPTRYDEVVGLAAREVAESKRWTATVQALTGAAK